MFIILILLLLFFPGIGEDGRLSYSAHEASAGERCAFASMIAYHFQFISSLFCFFFFSTQSQFHFYFSFPIGNWNEKNEMRFSTKYTLDLNRQCYYSFSFSFFLNICNILHSFCSASDSNNSKILTFFCSFVFEIESTLDHAMYS